MCAVVGSSASGLSTGLHPEVECRRAREPGRGAPSHRTPRPGPDARPGRAAGRRGRRAGAGTRAEQVRQPEPVVDPGRHRPSRQPTWPVHQRVDRVRIRVGADRPAEAPSLRTPTRSVAPACESSAGRRRAPALRRAPGRAVVGTSPCGGRRRGPPGADRTSGHQATSPSSRPRGRARRTSGPLRCSLRPPRRRLAKLPHLASVDLFRRFDQRRNTTRDADRDGFGTPPSIHGTHRAPSVSSGNTSNADPEVGDVRNTKCAHQVCRRRARDEAGSTCRHRVRRDVPDRHRSPQRPHQGDRP